MNSQCSGKAACATSKIQNVDTFREYLSCHNPCLGKLRPSRLELPIRIMIKSVLNVETTMECGCSAILEVGGLYARTRFDHSGNNPDRRDARGFGRRHRPADLGTSEQ